MLCITASPVTPATLGHGVASSRCAGGRACGLARVFVITSIVLRLGNRGYAVHHCLPRDAYLCMHVYYPSWLRAMGIHLWPMWAE